MLLGGFVVLFLGLAFFFFVLPQGLCASPAIMPTTACVALASQERTISTIPSEKSRASALLRTLAPAPSLFSTQTIASPSLGLSGHVGIGTTSPVSTLDVNGNITTAANSGLVFNAYYSGSWKYRANGYANAFYQDNSGDLIFSTFGNNSGGAGATATENQRMVILNGGNVGMGFTSPFFTLPIASIADVTQPAFSNFSWRVKRHQNPAHGMALTAAARDFDDHSRASPHRKAA
jgi:hypothetical protein